MIVCATPRCGGTIFCLDRAKETGASFIGELNPEYIKRLGRYGGLKQANHETAYQPQFELDEFLSHLQHVLSPDKIYLINESVSLALPSSSFRIATRNMDRAYRSMADLVIRSLPGDTPEMVYLIAARFCRAQLQSNILITRYSQMTGKPLLHYEDLYRSKGSYPHFEAFRQRDRLERLFVQLAKIEGKMLEKWTGSRAGAPEVP